MRSASSMSLLKALCRSMPNIIIQSAFRHGAHSSQLSMTQSAEKPSQAISWDLYSESSSCQNQQEWTQSIETPHMVLQRKVPIDTREHQACSSHVGSMNSHSCERQQQHSSGKGSEVAAQLCSQRKLQVQSRNSGIEKALTSSGTYRKTEQWQHSPLMEEFQRAIQIHLTIQDVLWQNPLTNPSAKVLLSHWLCETLKPMQTRIPAAFNFFINSCAAPFSVNSPNLDQLVWIRTAEDTWLHVNVINQLNNLCLGNPIKGKGTEPKNMTNKVTGWGMYLSWRRTYTIIFFFKKRKKKG